MAVRLGVSSPLVEHPRFPAIGSIGYWIHHTHTSPRSQTAWKMHVMFAVALSFFFFFSFMPGISDKHFHSMHHEIMPKYATPGALVMDWFLDRITIKEMTRSTHTHTSHISPSHLHAPLKLKSHPIPDWNGGWLSGLHSPFLPRFKFQ